MRSIRFASVVALALGFASHPAPAAAKKAKSRPVNIRGTVTSVIPTIQSIMVRTRVNEQVTTHALTRYQRSDGALAGFSDVGVSGDIRVKGTRLPNGNIVAARVWIFR